jgi:CheY-like chemotaxis protein
MLNPSKPVDAMIPGAAPAAKQILLVDDDEGYREATAAMLRAAGYTVQVTPDYRLALEILESDDPIDILVTDIVMPDRVNGIALSRMARMRRRDIRVIYISGYDIPGLEREAFGTMLRKPVDDDQLLTEIARTLST